MALLGGSANFAEPAAATAGETTLVVWVEATIGRVWIAGSLTASQDGGGDTEDLIIAQASSSVSWLDVATDGTDFFVVWSGHRESGAVACIVRKDGSRGVPVWVSENAPDARVASNGDNFLVVWQSPGPIELTYPYTHSLTRLFGRRFAADGTAIDAEPRPLTGFAASSPDVESDGSRYLIAWTDGTICSLIRCGLNTPLDLKARIFDGNMEPVSPEFFVTDDPRTNDEAAVVASRGDDWLIAWTATRRQPAPGVILAYLSDVGYAIVSPVGFITAAHRPELREETGRRSATAASNGKEYLVAWTAETSRLFVTNGIYVTPVVPGLPLDAFDQFVGEGGKPHLAGGAGATTLVYHHAQQVLITEIRRAHLPRRRASRP